uniref:Uncharacterized protein n=1 Tax=Tanacetum cinerariifolium TaxID=118510 RepID=A0A6L2J2D6_TANCI|nr:hypothetical protein [Tanacetum cinerariifolium]
MGGVLNSCKKIVQDVASSTSGSPNNTPLVAKINELKIQMIEMKLVLLGDDGKHLKPCKPTLPSSSNLVSKKVDDLVNEDSDSEVEEVYDETVTYMASTSSKVNKASKSGSGGGKQKLIYEAEVKSSSSTSHNIQNIAFVSSQNTDNTNESVSVVASDSADSTKPPAFILPSVDNLSDAEEMDLKWQMAMLTMRAKRFLQRTGRNLGANGTTSIGFDITKLECYNRHRRGHFARECRSPKDTRNKDTQRRNVPVEILLLMHWYHSMMVLVAMIGAFRQMKNQQIMPSCYLPPQVQQVLQVLTVRKSQFDVLSYKSGLESVEARLVVYQQNENMFEEDIKLLKLDVMLRDNALVSDSKDESEGEPMPTQKAHSFVQTSKHVKTPRTSVKPVEHPTQAENHRKDIPKRVTTVVPQSNVKHQRPANHVFNKPHSPMRRPINHRPTPKHSYFHQKVTAVKPKKVNVVQGTKRNWSNPQQALKDKGVIDSSFSRHMTGNISYLSNFEEIKRKFTWHVRDTPISFNGLYIVYTAWDSWLLILLSIISTVKRKDEAEDASFKGKLTDWFLVMILNVLN